VSTLDWQWDYIDEFPRLKKVQGKKKRDAAVAEAKRNAERELQGQPPVAYEVEEEEGGGDLLSSKDEDVIF